MSLKGVIVMIAGLGCDVVHTGAWLGTLRGTRAICGRGEKGGKMMYILQKGHNIQERTEKREKRKDGHGEEELTIKSILYPDLKHKDT